MLTKDELIKLFETAYNVCPETDKYEFYDVMFNSCMTKNGFMDDHDLIINRLKNLKYSYLSGYDTLLSVNYHNPKGMWFLG